MHFAFNDHRVAASAARLPEADFRRDRAKTGFDANVQQTPSILIVWDTALQLGRQYSRPCIEET